MARVIEARTLSEISDAITENQYVIVDFAAESWCVPCQRFKPHFDGVSDLLKEYVFVHVDIDEVDPIVTKVFGIQSVPTVVLFDKRSVAKGKRIEARTAITLLREVSLLTDTVRVV